MDAEQKYYEWDGFWQPEQFTTGEDAKRIAATVALIPSNVRSLADVGCGTGEFGRQVVAARPEIRVHSLDRSRAALKRVTTEKSVASIDALPLEDRSQDTVSCLQVLEHLPIPIYRKALEELARVANKYLLISVPFEENLATVHTTCPACGCIFNADLHLRSYGVSDVAAMFDAHGFRLLEHRTLGVRLQPLGLDAYNRVRGIISSTPSRFMAPNCPICGFERPGDFEPMATPAPRPTVSPLRKALQAVKQTVFDLVPKRRLPDYWIIGLFERT